MQVWLTYQRGKARAQTWAAGSSWGRYPEKSSSPTEREAEWHEPSFLHSLIAPAPMVPLLSSQTPGHPYPLPQGRSNQRALGSGCVKERLVVEGELIIPPGLHQTPSHPTEAYDICKNFLLFVQVQFSASFPQDCLQVPPEWRTPAMPSSSGFLLKSLL